MVRAKEKPESRLVIIRSVMTRSGFSSAIFARACLRLGSRDHAVARPLEDHAVDLEEVVIVVDDQYECAACSVVMASSQ